VARIKKNPHEIPLANGLAEDPNREERNEDQQAHEAGRNELIEFAAAEFGKRSTVWRWRGTGRDLLERVQNDQKGKKCDRFIERGSNKRQAF